jgi:peptide/nickel transport system substrate-binding protein
MNARLKTRSFVAVISAASVALIGFAAVPAHAAARTTAVIIESNTFTSLNTGNPDDNIVINGDVSYLTSMGLFHYDDKLKIVPNTILGTYKNIVNKPGNFQVKYTIAPGRLWSDGAAITAADWLLSHVVTSTDFAKAAGLPDPSDPAASPAFGSGAYGGVYDQHIVGLPTLSADKMSVTVKYDTAIPDWVLNGVGGPFPVHALELLAAGKTALPTVAEANAATAKFVSDFYAHDKAAFTAMGKIWTTGYEATTIGASTNPLLLVNNGAYLVKSVDTNQITMEANPKYNSGPALSGITTMVIKQGIGDGSPSAQAIANGDADVYQGQPTADAVAQLKAIKTATVVTSSSLAYEHIELRVAANGTTPYKGPFAMSGGKKAADLRKAFLLAYPRADIVDKLIKPINPNAVVLGSTWSLPGNPNYEHAASLNGSDVYSKGTQASRTAAALALVKKYYPTAGNGNTPIDINLLWGSPGNTRRTSEAALIIAAEAAVGFKVTAPATKGWGGKLTSSDYDAHFFIFDQTANPQDAQSCGTFQTNQGSNYTGYSNPIVDAACVKLQSATLPASTILRQQVIAEQQIVKDAFFMGIFQNPEVTAYNSALSGIVPAPLSPSLLWNFWTWKFTA